MSSLAIISVTPSQVGYNGGLFLDIVGVGFPNNGKGALIELCNTAVSA